MEEIDRLEELARDWTGLFPQAAVPGPSTGTRSWPRSQAHAARGYLPPGGGGRGQIRQEHHDQRPGGPGPVASGRRHPHRHDHPGPARSRSRGRCSSSRIGTKSTVKSAGPWGCCPIPAWWTGRRPWICRRPQTGSSWPRSWPRPRRPTSGPGGSLDQNYLLLKSYLEGYDLLKDLMPATGVLPSSRSGPGPAPGPGHPGGHRGVPQGRAPHHPLPLAGPGGGAGRLPGERLAHSPSTWPRSWPISSRATWRFTSSAPGWGCARRIFSFWRS